jgi:hypothetical protein
MLLAAFCIPFGLGRARRRESLIVGAQIWFELAFWFTVPYSNNMNVFANVRYLMPALGLVFAGGVVIGERRRIGDGWMEGLTLALLAQGMLQLHSQMPRGVRVAMGVADVAAVLLAFSPALRAFLRRHWRVASLAATAAALLLAPVLTAFRVEDRGRALAGEFTVHMTSTRMFAGGWDWLDKNGADGAVASVHSPNNYFQYPAMGPRLERASRYININRADHRRASEYPQCQPRVDPDPDAWVANLAKQHIRWVHLSRYPQFDFSMEQQWADARPQLFALRYQDDTNRVYELLPGTPMAPPATSP